MANLKLWDENNFNISEEDSDRKIYHIIPLDYFLSGLNNKKLTLVSPFNWKDPFEGIYLNTIFIQKTEDLDSPLIIKFAESFKNIFGQSWSFVKESNLMWETYARGNRMALKVETTVSTIQEKLKNNSNGYDKEIYFGKIKYLSREEYYKMIQSKNPTINVDQHNRDIYDTLFYKTIPFKDEMEFRVLFSDKEKTSLQKIIELDFDWIKGIEMIELSPELNDDFVEQLKKLVNGNFEICKSELNNKKIIRVEIP